VKGKQSECHALFLNDNMIKAYARWDLLVARGDKERGDKQIVSAARVIVNHLETQFRESGLPEKQAPYYSQLMGINTALRRYDSGEDSGILAMEVVRDTLHKSPELKQLMAYGTPLKDKDALTNTAKVLSDVFETMAGTSKNPTEDARALLDTQYKKVSCGSNKE